MPSLESEVNLIESYGNEVIAITLNTHGMTEQENIYHKNLINSDFYSCIFTFGGRNDPIVDLLNSDMIIDNIDELADIKLTRPYTIAYKTTSSIKNIFVKIILRDGTIGLGSSNVSKYVVGAILLSHIEIPLILKII